MLGFMLNGNRGQLIEIEFADEQETASVQVVLTAAAPDDVREKLREWSVEVTSTGLKEAANELAQRLVGLGWGVQVDWEVQEFKLNWFELEPDKMPLLLRYAPVVVDDRVYFCMGIPKPSGTFRHTGMPPAAFYINPLTGEEWYRELCDSLNRFSFAKAEQVQAVLEQIRPLRYTAWPIRCDNGGEICLVRNRQVSKSLVRLALPDLQQDDVDLDEVLTTEVRRIMQRVRPNNNVGTLAVACRLLESPAADRFIRLSKIYSGH